MKKEAGNKLERDQLYTELVAKAKIFSCFHIPDLYTKLLTGTGTCGKL